MSKFAAMSNPGLTTVFLVLSVWDSTYAMGKLRLAAGKSGINGAGIPQRRTLFKN